MSAYYNEFDPYAARWLRNLIAAGHIAAGDVDERSIVEVSTDDLRRYTQCHFFAGIGVWSHALRKAGWADDRPVWTGSCPCQPFSTAGRRKGHEDERHLWPTWFRLIRECRPVAIFGEQVANGDGAAWLDYVATDLEGDDYTVGAVSAPACGFGAPHIRQRLYWVAHAEGGDGRLLLQQRRPQQNRAEPERRGEVGALAESDGAGSPTQGIHAGEMRCVQEAQREPEHGSALFGRGRLVGNALGNADEQGSQRRRLPEISGGGGRDHQLPSGSPGPVNGFWGNADWLPCRDGKARPVEPGTFPLAHGVAGRVGRLRAYGNAINAQQAEAFVRAAA